MHAEITTATSAADDLVLQERYDAMAEAREREADALRAYQSAEFALKESERVYFAAKEARMAAEGAFHRANGRQQRLSAKLNRRAR